MIPETVLKEYGIIKLPESYGNGHINDTFLSSEIILQRINTEVFKDYSGLMYNIRNVTDYLKHKLSEIGEDPDRGVLSIFKTVSGNDYVVSDLGVYRAYKYINNSISYDETTEKLLYYSGLAFGKFLNLLNDYPVSELKETIPDFHNTRKRFKYFLDVLNSDPKGRARFCQKEIDFVVSNEDVVDTVTNGLEDGTIPLRITHNDTKINNVLFDKSTGLPLCIVDLDTVMPGSFLYDFGDAVRSGCTTALEDEENLESVTVDLDKFKALTDGYIKSMGDVLYTKEIELMAFSGFLLTYECGMRFLTDYLSGDVYFKIHKKDHNLIRAKNQFKLASEIKMQLPQLDKIVYDSYNAR